MLLILEWCDPGGWNAGVNDDIDVEADVKIYFEVDNGLSRSH